MCGCNATVRHRICMWAGFPLVWQEYLPRTTGAAPVREGAWLRRRWPCALCESVCDVVLCDVLPGSSRRVRAAGEIGEFAGAGDRAPQFGAALAAIGGEGESDAPQPRARAGA